MLIWNCNLQHVWLDVLVMKVGNGCNHQAKQKFCWSLSIFKTNNWLQLNYFLVYWLNLLSFKFVGYFQVLNIQLWLVCLLEPLHFTSKIQGSLFQNWVIQFSENLENQIIHNFKKLNVWNLLWKLPPVTCISFLIHLCLNLRDKTTIQVWKYT